MTDNLYSLSQELAVIHDELVENGGELTDELIQRLDDCNLAFNDKAFNIVRWTKNIEGKEAALEAEIERLQSRKKAAGNLKERLKTYLLESMVRADKTKLDFDTFTVAIQKNPPSCIIEDEKVIPAKYITIIPETRQVDKKAVLAALKAGENVGGASLIADKVHLRIR